jgi:hypothetical protein
MTERLIDNEHRSILLGFAVDVSGSMQKSIQNQDRSNDNGFRAFRDSLRELSKRVKQEIEMRQKEGINISIHVFAQAFGLKELENCDLLTLMEFGSELAKADESSFISRFNSPYDELESIADRNGVTDISGFSEWIKQALPSAKEVSNLAIVLRRHPKMATYVSNFLPKNFLEAQIAGKGLFIKDKVSFLSSVPLVGDAISNSETVNKLARARALAQELARASSRKEIRQIVIREIGSDLEEEISKRGNTLKPLIELAELIDTKEDELEDLDSLIYGNTPMKGAMQIVQQRFAIELRKQPKETISVLFIISDGQPTDGNPLPFTTQLNESGTYIVTCFLTNRSIVDPRKLFEVPELSWDEGSRLMFEMASTVDRNSVFVESLLERNWEVPFRPKLFVQANHPDILNEFTQIIVSLCKDNGANIC